jgi:hypothetical protein
LAAGQAGGSVGQAVLEVEEGEKKKKKKGISWALFLDAILQFVFTGTDLRE